jgi:hypothetical protein
VASDHLAEVLPLHANAPQVLHVRPQATLDAAVVQAGTLCEGLVQLDPRDACALQERAHRAITALVGPDRRHGGSLHVKKVRGQVRGRPKKTTYLTINFWQRALFQIGTSSVAEVGHQQQSLGFWMTADTLEKAR